MKKGFTLVELMAVMIILGILTLIAVPAVTSMIKTSKEDALNITINNIKLAMRDFNKDYNLDSDGEAGPATFSKINEQLLKLSQSTKPNNNQIDNSQSSTTPKNNLYRIRKSWSDINS